MNDVHLRLSDNKSNAPPVTHPPIGRVLLDQGKIASNDLTHALNLQRRIDAPLGDIMISEGLINKKDVLSALAAQARAEGADLELDPPEMEMANRLPASLCLRFGVVPWREDARALYVATSSPAGFTQLLDACGPQSRQLFPVIVDDAQIQAHQSRLYGNELAQGAAVRVPAQESCRSWADRGHRRLLWAAMAFCSLVSALVFAPAWSVTALALWAVITLLMTSTLKAAALFIHLSGARAVQGARASGKPFRMPRVSVLVPLLKEKEIAGQLIARLSQLTYPKSLLNVVLVLEEGDTLTRQTIARTTLPDWMSVIEVPEAGGLTTKPRALNYALDFCKGSIIGVWDAEDWPEADQIEKVVTRFNTAPDNVVCLQGRSGLLQFAQLMARAVFHDRICHLVAHRDAGHCPHGPCGPAGWHDPVFQTHSP